jgi:hypothetical protein
MNFDITTMKIETINELKEFVNQNDEKLTTAFNKVKNDKTMFDFQTLSFVHYVFLKNSKPQSNVDDAIDFTLSYYGTK